jgi:hypothetical protein
MLATPQEPSWRSHFESYAHALTGRLGRTETGPLSCNRKLTRLGVIVP